MDARAASLGCPPPPGGLHHPQDAAEQETMDYLEFIARVTAHIPDKGQATMRYHGLYANAIFIDHLKVTFYKCRSRRVIDIAVRPEVYY